MRSLSSYPYSQKLTDYWADKGVLTMLWVMRLRKKNTFYAKMMLIHHKIQISKNRSVGPNDENEYEEEDY
jgi:hypothetical protein